MKDNNLHIESLELEIESLKAQLEEANTIIDAIKEGEVDALVLTKDGQPHLYSLETADYTYRILIEKFGEGALSISDGGLILYCNEYFSKLLDLPASKIIGTYFTDYVESPEAFMSLKNNALSDGPSKGEIILNHKDKQLHVYISLTDLRPNVSAIGVVVTDLSEKRKHERDIELSQHRLEIKVNELNQTNTNLEQFIHVISHDLKEPIRKIMTYTSHLYETKAKLFSDNEVRNLNVINSSAVRLNSLVDDLVKYAFSATKDVAKSVNLNTVLGEVLDDLELIITETGAKIESVPLPKISGSKVQMRQLFSNLFANAIKYHKDGVAPIIKITTSVVDGPDAFSLDQKFYKIAIEDNGIGMELTHLTKIFTIFQRLHMRNEYSGNGIGLAICKKIMENHQGKIDVESTPGKGSTFNLYFPVTVA